MIGRSRSRLLAPALLASALFTAAPSHAGDKALAEALFQEAKKLLAEGKHDEACPKLVESNKQDPSPGTLLNLGKCYDGQGRTASAWASYKEAGTMARARGRTEQEAAAQEASAALEPKLSKLKIDAPPSPIPGLVVKRDGVELGLASLGTSLAVDPGEHTVTAEAPGYKTWEGKVTLGKEKDSQSIAIPALEKGADPPPDIAGPGGAAMSTDGANTKTLGFVVGGAGVAFLGAGFVLGAMASGQASDAESDPKLCPNKVCTPAGRAEIDGAETKALLSTIGIGVGAVAIGTGVVLILTSKSPPKETAAKPRLVPSVGPTGGGLSLSGTF